MRNIKDMWYTFKHKVRIWLMDCLDCVSIKYHQYSVDELKSINNELAKEISRYERAVREICRRSDKTYYDWACDQCATPCKRHNGWCDKFMPQ